jgi:DNA-binding NarL/FixJ family response regulator
MVADGNAIDRAGLKALIGNEPDMDVVASTATIEATLEACDAQAPDVLLLTLMLPGSDGAEALPAILAAHPKLPIVALSGHSLRNCLVLNPPFKTAAATPGGNGPVLGQGVHRCSHGTTCLRGAAERGARGTVRRSSPHETLLEAIRVVHAGGVSHEAEVNEPCMDNDALRPLSERERTVAAHLSRGLSNKEIASALDISEATVKKHVGRVLAKLGLQDRLQAGLYLARNPLVLSAPSDAGGSGGH